MKKTILLTTGLLLLLAATSFTSAQSSNRDRPTPLTSNELRGVLGENKDEHFYSFTAGPGELTITADIEPAQGSGTTNITFELLDRNAAKALLCCEYVQGDFGATGRKVASVKLTKRETVILHITEDGGNGTFRFRFSGATSFGGSTGGGDYSNDNGNGRERGEGGEQINVPTSGILHIRMKNGTTKDIDLSLIRSVTVRP